MKRLVCEMCGGSDLVKQDGVFICQNCGTKYSVEEAKKMMVEGAVTVEGTVAVEGTVKVDKSEELKNLYILARRAKEADNSENACKYYNEIVLKDPDNWEANFYLVYYKAASCKKGQIGNEAYNVTNCLKSTIKLLVENLGTGDEAKGFIDGIRKDLAEIAGPMIHGAMDVHEYSYIGQILRMQEMLGNSLKEYPELHSQAVDAWKQLIATYIKYACFGEVKIDYVDMYGYTPEDAVRAIYELDPSYEDPFGITKKLRRNEKFITCPKCGATMRERESKCPQCGTPKEEIQRLIAEKEAAEAAERERISKEQKAKEAEEARIRAEKRAEWWAANKKKVGVALCFLCLIVISAFSFPKMIQKIKYDRYIKEANICAENADANAAIALYNQARIYTGNDCNKLNYINEQIRFMNDSLADMHYINANIYAEQKKYKDAVEQCELVREFAMKGHGYKIEELSSFEAKIKDSLLFSKMGKLSALYKSYDCIFLQGFIDGKYPVHMTLRTNGGNNGSPSQPYIEWIEGVYYYDRVQNGKENHMTLELDGEYIQNAHIRLKEFNPKGKLTGIFDGTAENNIYKGYYKRASDGKRMNFELRVQSTNDGSFIEM